MHVRRPRLQAHVHSRVRAALSTRYAYKLLVIALPFHLNTYLIRVCEHLKSHDRHGSAAWYNAGLVLSDGSLWAFTGAIFACYMSFYMLRRYIYKQSCRQGLISTLGGSCSTAGCWKNGAEMSKVTPCALEVASPNIYPRSLLRSVHCRASLF